MDRWNNLLTLYNSLTKKYEVFQPLEKERVKVYTCGPSIYRLPHIGNYRTFLFEDVLQRYLEYLGYRVERVLNITDIEDKAIAEAETNQVDIKELTERNLTIFLNELHNLRAKTPDHLPRSSTSIEQAVYLIEVLLKKGYAYWHKGNVYYDPLKFKGFGKLYGLDMSEWPQKKRRFHKDTYPGNRWNRGDFILWRGYKEGDTVYWDTKIGRGRPSWNIQDSAMATEHIGFKADICCGGIDNIIRHHDYIIAVIEGVSDEPFAPYWLHAAHLFVKGKKMSKSKGNIIYPRGLLEQGYQWSHLRFFLIYGQYRRRLNFTPDKFVKSCERLETLRQNLKIISRPNSVKKSNTNAQKRVDSLEIDFKKSMDNDLNVKDAFDKLERTVSKLVPLKNKLQLSREDSEETITTLKRIDSVFQVIF